MMGMGMRRNWVLLGVSLGGMGRCFDDLRGLINGEKGRGNERTARSGQLGSWMCLCMSMNMIS